VPLRAERVFYEQELPVPLVSLDQALKSYEEGNHLFIDTRPDALEENSHIPGAFLIREASFDDDLQEYGDFLYPEDPLILYGEGNLLGVAAVAGKFLDRGYENLLILAGGLPAWHKAGGPLTKEGGGDHD
jgi:3-mercaptopyruvate sulfurtransferase SseA